MGEMSSGEGSKLVDGWKAMLEAQTILSTHHCLSMQEDLEEWAAHRAVTLYGVRMLSGVSVWSLKPAKVEAIRYTGENYDAILEWLRNLGGRIELHVGDDAALFIDVIVSNIEVRVGDWLVRDRMGSLAGVENTMFLDLYQPEDRKCQVATESEPTPSLAGESSTFPATDG